MAKKIDLMTLFILMAMLVSSLYTAFTFPLVPDEAYYWLWSKHVAPGYFDHPPMIAWWLAAVEWLGGDSVFAVRLPGIVAWLLSSIVLWHLAKVICSSTRAGLIAFMLFALSPAFQFVIMVTTPDTVLLAFVALYLLLLQRVLVSGTLLAWASLGVLTGCIGLSKYNGVIIPLALVVSLCLSTQGRVILTSPGPWLAGVCAAMVVSPVLVWNYQHDWVSLVFQFEHGFVTDTQIDHVNNLIVFGSVQSMMYFLPVLFVCMIYAFVMHVRYRRLYGSNALFVDNTVLISLLTLLLFAYVFVFKGGEHNWTAIAYVTGIIPLSALLDRYANAGARQSLRLSILLCITALMAAIMLFTVKNLHLLEQVVGTNIARTQATHAYGGQQIAARLQKLFNAEKRFATGQCSIVSGTYQSASWLAWNLRNTTQIAHFSGQGRQSQFDLWRAEHMYPQPCFFVSVYRNDEAIPEVTTFNGDKWYILEILTSRNPDNTTTHVALYRQ